METKEKVEETQLETSETGEVVDLNRSPEQEAKEVLRRALNEREIKCEAEIKASLEKYNCTMTPVMTFAGRNMTSSITIKAV